VESHGCIPMKQEIAAEYTKVLLLHWTIMEVLTHSTPLPKIINGTPTGWQVELEQW
jgi:hypothetical protein